jgi:Holliday junction resolvase RusA-like endonuclease
MNAQRWKTTPTARYALTLHVFWHDKRARDLSNIAKAIEDAMNGAVFRDDSQIDALLVYGAVDRERPRVEVEVREIEAALPAPIEIGRVTGDVKKLMATGKWDVKPTRTR